MHDSYSKLNFYPMKVEELDIKRVTEGQFCCSRFPVGTDIHYDR